MRDVTGYALDLITPIRYVATELDRAAPAALSISRLADGYEHHNSADLHRIKLHEHAADDHEATVWLMGKAVELLERRGEKGKGLVQVVAENGGFRLADGITFDDLVFDGKKLHRIRNDHAVLHDPFNPMTAKAESLFFSAARMDSRDASLDELRESLRTGWLKHLPALVDENGVTLVGHRRLALAKELGIEPVIQTVRLGEGDEADAERFRYAIKSNLGAKPFTKTERERIAEYLYGERGWSQQRIAEALNVSQRTVSRALERGDISHVANVSVDSLGRRKNQGRKRKFTREEERELGHLVYDLGMPQNEAEHIVRPDEPKRAWATKGALTALAREEARREEGGVCTCPNCGNKHTVNP